MSQSWPLNAPVAARSDVLGVWIDGVQVLYDPHRERAHVLNPTAAVIHSTPLPPSQEYTRTDFRTRMWLAAPMAPVDCAVQGAGVAVVQRVTYSANLVEIDYRADRPAWLVFNEIHAPGWTARVDGRPVPLLRANALFRGACVPGGRHRLAFRFDPLRLIRSLHHRRNRVPVAATIGRLLDETRMHVRFALEYSGEQVLANVLRIADLARQYEAEGGISFRGFLDALAEQAESGEVSEAPILEEGSEGVRLMTVHKAKGLEFPVVILADMTAKLRPAAASRYLDQSRRLCAIRLAGCAPADLVTHGLLELERDRAEGVRVAYVAATRAQDLLVVPAVGDEERDGWLETLNGAIFPPQTQRRSPVPTAICPTMRSR